MSRVLAAWAAVAVSGLFITLTSTAALADTPSPSPTPTGQPASCNNTSTGLTALTDLGGGTYQSEQGGLYPGGSNTPPYSYRAAGIQAARSVVPLDPSGNANSGGKIVFLSIGMSNATMEFSSFMNSEANDPQRNQAVTMVDGAQGGQAASAWTSSSSSTWSVVDQRLAGAGVTAQQVEVIWSKQADMIQQPLDFQTYARTLQQEIGQIDSIAAQRFPNLREIFISPRTYGGYSGIDVVGGGPNPEPWAYQTGFADKWVIAQSVANPSQRPWVSWGPYWWTDGTRGRADGLTWLCSDTADGTHPSSSGLGKTDSLLHSMFTTSTFTPWFTGSARVNNPPPTQPPPNPTSNPVSSVPTSQPVGGAGGTHPSTPKAGANAQPSAATSSPPQQSSSTPASIPTVIAAVASKPGWQREALILVGLFLLGFFLTGVVFLLRGRRPVARDHGPAAPSSQEEVALATSDPDQEPDKSPILAGAKSETADSREADSETR